MKLALPEGFTAPKDARPGEPFEVVATLNPSEDGSFTLIAVDGVKLSKTDEDEPAEQEEDMPADERTDASEIRLPFED